MYSYVIVNVDIFILPDENMDYYLTVYIKQFEMVSSKDSFQFKIKSPQILRFFFCHQKLIKLGSKP
jgi:hypothetical protein